MSEYVTRGAGIQKICGNCRYFGTPGNDGCAFGNFRPSHFTECKNDKFHEKDRPPHRSLGNPGSFHVVHHGEVVRGQKIIRSKEGVKIFKTGSKKRGRSAPTKK